MTKRSNRKKSRIFFKKSLEGKEEMESYRLMGYRVSVLHDEKFWKSIFTTV